MDKWKKFQSKIRSSSVSSYFKIDDEIDSFNSRIDAISFENCSEESEQSEEVFTSADTKSSTPKADRNAASCTKEGEEISVEKKICKDLNVEASEQRGTEKSQEPTLQLRSGNKYIRKCNLYSFPKRRNSFKNNKKAIQYKKANQSGLLKSSSENIIQVSENKIMVFEKVSKLVSRLIPSFSGTNQTSNELQIFLDCAKQVYEALSAEEKTVFLNLLKTRLRGDAYDLVKNVVITSLSQLETLLLNTYAPTKTINDHLGDLRKCVQNPTENINSYSGRVSRHLVDCKKAILTKYPQNHSALVTEVEQEAIYAFKTGIISPIIRQAVISKASESLEQLIEIAKEVEKTELMSTSRLQNSLHSLENSTDFKFNTEDVVSAPHIRTNFQENLNYGNNQKPFPTPQLHNTVTTHNNHQLLNLPSNSVPIQYFRQRITQPTSRTNQFRCTFCNRIGHTYGQCRTRQRTPKCTTCNQFGHKALTCTQPQVFFNTSDSTQLPKTRRNKGVKCEWCARWGHDLNTCRAKTSYEARTQNNSAEN